MVAIVFGPSGWTFAPFAARRLTLTIAAQSMLAGPPFGAAAVQSQAMPVMLPAEGICLPVGARPWKLLTEYIHLMETFSFI